MWTEIGTASGAIALIGLVLSMQNVKINKTVSKELCEERHSNTEERLKRGMERFEKNDKLLATLNKEQVEQGKVLIEVYTVVKRIEKKSNGN